MRGGGPCVRRLFLYLAHSASGEDGKESGSVTEDCGKTEKNREKAFENLP